MTTDTSWEPSPYFEMKITNTSVTQYIYSPAVARMRIPPIDSRLNTRSHVGGTVWGGFRRCGLAESEKYEWKTVSVVKMKSSWLKAVLETLYSFSDR
ncbi:hypothetical protein STEG23_015331 [Scotinomys teguina]